MPATRAAAAAIARPPPDAPGATQPQALAALAALGQPTRIEIVRLLMRVAPEGLPAGAIADALGCPHTTLSSHLGILARAGLVRGTRASRSIVYRADVAGMRSLIAFLVTDCCDGHPELCGLGGRAAARHRSGLPAAEKFVRGRKCR
jgi:DNA-binding transcriptional ArsR family regulator